MELGRHDKCAFFVPATKCPRGRNIDSGDALSGVYVG